MKTMNELLISSEIKDKIDMNQQRNQMKGIQISPNLRYLSMKDEDGVLGLFIVHDEDTVRYTIQVSNYDEFRATIESFQEQPV
jgi:hypothetical protein